MSTATAEMRQVRETMFQRFRGRPPEIATYPEIDVELLQEGDDDPFYLRLKILEVRQTPSANGLIYDEALVSELLRQLPGEGGKLGHSGWLGRSDEPDELNWVGHVRVGNEVWAKCYIAKEAVEVRSHMRRKLAANGGIGTSIVVQGIPEYADLDGRTFRLLQPQLLGIDLVHHATASLDKDPAFIITSEKRDRAHKVLPETPETEGKPKMEITRESIIAALTPADVPASVRESILRESQLAAEAARVPELQSQIEAERTARGQAETVRAEAERLLAEARTALDAANAQIAEARNATFQMTFTRVVEATTADWQVTTEAGKAAVASLHRMVAMAAREALSGATDDDAIVAAVEAAWRDCADVAEAVKLKISGGSAIVAPNERRQESAGLSRFNTPEGRAELRTKFGPIIKS